MAVSIGLSDGQHPLESSDGGCKKDVIIGVPKYSSVFAHDRTSVAAALEEFKEIKAVEAVGESC